MDTLFSHVNVVTMNEQMTLWQDAFVGVTDGKIAYMAKKPPEEKPKKIIDATGMVLMPGLINCHTHLPMYLLRGYADDLNLQDWLQHYIFPREDRLDGRAVKAATTLALAEALRFGTTSVSDMYYFCDEICQAVAESGIKANISRGTSMFLGDDFCFDTFPACQELVALKDKWHNYDNGRIKIEASIHAEYTSTYQLWDALAEYAVNNGLQLQVHLSETKKEHDACVEKYGLTPAQVLDCHHVFDVPTVAAHCVHVTQEDMQLLPPVHGKAAPDAVDGTAFHQIGFLLPVNDLDLHRIPHAGKGFGGNVHINAGGGAVIAQVDKRRVGIAAHRKFGQRCRRLRFAAGGQPGCRCRRAHF